MLRYPLDPGCGACVGCKKTRAADGLTDETRERERDAGRRAGADAMADAERRDGRPRAPAHWREKTTCKKILRVHSVRILPLNNCATFT